MTSPRTRRTILTALTLINATKGRRLEDARRPRRTDYRLLDIYESAAVARVDAGRLSTARQMERPRVIVNVLWELRPQPM